MRDNPREIAKNLVLEHGLGRALRIAVEGTATSKEEGHSYGLSVWHFYLNFHAMTYRC
jgi:hypothetical protein